MQQVLLLTTHAGQILCHFSIVSAGLLPSSRPSLGPCLACVVCLQLQFSRHRSSPAPMGYTCAFTKGKLGVKVGHSLTV